MAKFNEKVLCLFHKDYKQLKKEADRRGIPYETKEKTIARIIWKDAFDAGVIAGRDARQVCPIAAPQIEDYCFYDCEAEKRYRMKLLKEQLRMIEWLIDNDFIHDVDIMRWEDQDYEDVGRI